MAFFHLLDSMFQVPPEHLLPVTSQNHNVSVYYTPEKTRSKITKADIGSPSNFKHVSHVGWKALAGVDTNSEADLRRLFNEAGSGEEHLKDCKTSCKTFNIIEKRGGMEAVRKEACELASSRISTPSLPHQSLPSSTPRCSKNEQIRWSYLFPAYPQNPMVAPAPQTPQPSDGGIAAALMEVIQKRHKAISSFGM
ncbi:neural Wiskott-Aldrich syndrome protein-like isoform X2 [Rhinatrema bivittatum]|uniref:neural Wiskott-Aldrich syndrome protein-like isoform X2 n=1 Tax=Rhinatrema bivittatum TaxID=194408 RepID=UPI00112AE372|nr:neural Wiskott-Aldrich syndrome protein-like isoform X2 [Rhinatrema bivittatum]